ncbi:polysaccharide biosynthesis/export family protein [Pseudomonas sp. GD04087]|uniref:polysaccharide biosynthesis/export family protein n=1 Tax=unclassified Pseudomonas TaxID=196821 RepID=UPI00244B29D4|nr:MULTISPECIES: polysaccharide biosynthesis/export family protein [unclassified Pseudomonas]MDH0291982.1 polysaccharide biosynthesis/export family protein [Pseudomonas sp. GD04087]MDH1052830.1 polysaccharide biosynthesis/export family protein [Pseudomonas sp. GD03903]MDH2001993.1 polysaccharide biosynthesis/export family protein [Pseudomonas sp. GD03691]
MIRPLSLAILSALALQGCMFSPGQNLDTERLIQEDSAESSRVQLVQITPKLLTVEAATRQEEAVPEALASFRPESYQIGAGDLLYITVWDHPELTSPAGQLQQGDANGRLVRPDGTLFYPYVGTLRVSGRTIEDVRKTITSALAAYVEEPQVDIAVLRFASQRVILNGAFIKAGPQPITTTPLALMEAIGAAQLDTLNADLSGLTLQRDNQVFHLNLDALNTAQGADLYNLYLKDGDRIYLPYNDRKKVYLMGEVNAPRALTFKTREMNLADALGSVGGLNQTTANGKAVYVIRGVEDLEKQRATVFQLDANSPTAFILAQQFQLQPQDVVYVGPAGVTRWNRLISQLLPSAGILGTGSTIQRNLNDN